MTTPVYVKMDAHEQLLLSEGVCWQLGIISYHPEVQACPPKKESESNSPVTSNPCQVPSVKVQLVQSIKLPQNQSVMVEARLVGDTKLSQGPVLLEATDRRKNEMGLQLVDEFIQLTDELTNSSGITQRVGEGTEIGIALPVEVVEPPPQPT